MNEASAMFLEGSELAVANELIKLVFNC